MDKNFIDVNVWCYGRISDGNEVTKREANNTPIEPEQTCMISKRTACLEITKWLKLRHNGRMERNAWTSAC